MSRIVNSRSATRSLCLRTVEIVAGRRLDVEQLVGVSEIARRLGVGRTQAVHMWRKRHADFPQPVAVLDMGLVFYWPDVERWAKATGRL